MKMYMKYLSIHLRSVMQHKLSFLMTVIGHIMTSLSAAIVVMMLFNRFGTVEGFTLEQVMICYSVVLMAFSLAECFARGFDVFPRLIGNGQFDRMMVRPRNEVFQVLASTVELTRIGRLIQAAAVLMYAVPNCGVEWTAARAALLAFMILGGTALFAALFWVYAGLSFFSTEGLEFMNVFTDGGRDHGAYPMAIYGREVLAFYTYVVPLACVQYYPLMYLLGRWDNPWLAACPLAGFAFAIPAYLIWRLGVRHYRSTGS